MLLCTLEAVEVSNFAGGVGGAGGDALCATLYAGGCGGYALFMELFEVLEVPETIRCVLLCMLEGWKCRS